MIENIKIKEIKGLGQKIKTIEFKNRNIIIGPKGGGKSTIFDLVANAAKGKYLSSTKDALESFGLQLHSIKISGEDIPSSSLDLVKLPKRKLKEIEKLYKDRNDVIYQDDIIKKNLSETDDFTKMKKAFALEITQSSNDALDFINKIKEVHYSINRVIIMRDSNINFSNAFLINGKETASKEKIIFSVNYNKKDFQIIIDKDIKYLENIIKELNNEVGNLNFKIKSLQSSNSFINQNYKNFLFEKYRTLIKVYNDIVSKTKEELQKIWRINKTINAFKKAYDHIVAEIKKENSESDNKNKLIDSYISSAEEHFISMARKLKKAKHSFESFIVQDLVIDIEESKPADNLLTMEFKGSLKFSEPEKYDFLKKVLHNAKKIQTDVAYWILEANEKGVKEFKETNLLKAISDSIKEKIIVSANGEDYETMSLGQKSIYGIKYKFNWSKGQPMFLDQPEDNLDNYTVANEILKLINNKEEQMFIVTHNANIGILSKPDRVIVGMLNKKTDDKLDQYIEGTVKEENKHSDTAYYLEGGIKYIQDRLEIIKGVK